jgi:hypothetical protein
MKEEEFRIQNSEFRRQKTEEKKREEIKQKIAKVAWPLFLFCMDSKIRSRWSLAGMTKLQDRDKL